MTHHLNVLCIALIIVICFGYLHYCKLNDTYANKNNTNNKNNSNNTNTNKKIDTTSISDLIVDKNKLDIKKYQKAREETLQESNFNLGYSVLSDTNPDTVGLCPLGYYFKGEFTGNSEDIKTKCLPCFNCQKELGYYVSGGCMGDSDSVCKFGKVPFDIYINAHEGRNPLHSQLPRYHTHKILDNTLLRDKMSKSKKISKDVHLHI